jgi:hypothetical protein
MRNCASGNLEIPGSRFARPGMTMCSGAQTAQHHPDLRLLVFCVTLPCPACSRMLCFSSSRWPLVVSTGTSGVLPGPLWLLLSSGTGLMGFFCGLVIISLRY